MELAYLRTETDGDRHGLAHKVFCVLAGARVTPKMGLIELYIAHHTLEYFIS
jgi:hypothetical protein